MELETKFLGHQYKLHEWDCYSLVCKFHGITPVSYKTESDIYKYGKDDLTYIFGKNIEIINLDKLENNDILVFSRKGKSQLIHFGIFILANRILHVSENNVSKIESIPESYRKRMLCGVRCMNK